MKTGMPLATMLSLISASTVVAQTAPSITNVEASQRTDGSRLVDVYYDLSHNASATVWVVFSGDGGLSWNVPAMTMTGDFGTDVAPGSGRHIIWDAPADIPGVAGTYRARVYADDAVSSSDMVFVAGGTFPYQRNFAQPIMVGSFFIDKYEVTNQRYAEFLNDGDPDGTYWNDNMEITRSGTPPNVYYAVDPGRQNYPIHYVSAIDAEAYAAWLSAREGRSYRLPTEQEWEKAAAWDPISGTHWLYGFQSNSISCADANYGGASSNGCPGMVTEVGSYDGTGGTNNAHSYYGSYDMSGNVREWTASEYGATPSYCTAAFRVARGGSWNAFDEEARTIARCTYYHYGNRCRGCGLPETRAADIGFRLALDPD